MKKRKLVWSLLIAGLFLFTGTNLSLAQNKGTKTPEEIAKKRTDKMKTELSLNDDQYSKIEAINLEAANQVMPLRQQNQENREKIKAIRKENRDRIAAILTPEQKKILEEKRSERKKAAGNRNSRGMRPRRGK